MILSEFLNIAIRFIISLPICIMPKRMLVDTNILIDFSQGSGHARKFFEDAKENYHEIHVMQEVYSEAKRIAPNFERITLLLEDLKRYGTYERVELTAKEKEYSHRLEQRCIELIGRDLGEVDRRIIAAAKTRNLILVSRDNDLKKVAKAEGVKLF